MRNFIRNHPDYKHDSVVSQEINYDLLVAMDEMLVFFCSVDSSHPCFCSERGVRRAPDLLPEEYKGSEC